MAVPSLRVLAVAALSMSHKSVIRVTSRLYGSNLLVVHAGISMLLRINACERWCSSAGLGKMREITFAPMRDCSHDTVQSGICILRVP